KKLFFLVSAYCVLNILFCHGQSQSEKNISIRFSGDGNSLYWVAIRDNSKRLIKFIPAREEEKGRYFAFWDGSDSKGDDASSGVYNVYISKGIEWAIDRNFGIDGRIGLFHKQVSVDPDLPKIQTQGSIFSVFVNDIEYRDTGDALRGETSFIVSGDTLTLNPVKLSKTNTARISYFYPCFLENPWDLAIAPDGKIFVLLRLKKMFSGAYSGLVIKLNRDGRDKDMNFGVEGEIPGIHRAHQILVVPQDNRIYIAGSEYGTYGTGSYKLDSGAYWFYIGGHKDQGRHPATTWWPTGIAIGDGNKIHIGDLKVYDRTKPMLEGYLYCGTANPYVIRPGPSLEKSAKPDFFYRTGWNTGISKMKDTGKDIVEIYSLKLPFKTIGISYDAERSLIYAGSRYPDGFVSIIYDDGKSFKEITRLNDPDLVGIHTVRVFDDYLYVIEDGVSYTEDGYCAEEMNMKTWTSSGKNRISRYRVIFGKEMFLQKIKK
ncbi:MAG: hypothetical protein NC831_05150, partial [Candidatus Omnitrophica bacterium]|nr:hypothetical protein [Candidatus Omnitrophota bacterium]